MTPVANRRAILLASLGVAASMTPAAALTRGAAPVARTTAGRVEGATERGIHTFKGIRYGADSARFMPPARPKPWREVKKTLAYGPVMPAGLERGEPERRLPVPERLDPGAA
jgi:para-nitrobenzyl esterase